MVMAPPVFNRDRTGILANRDGLPKCKCCRDLCSTPLVSRDPVMRSVQVGVPALAQSFEQLVIPRFDCFTVDCQTFVEIDTGPTISGLRLLVGVHAPAGTRMNGEFWKYGRGAPPFFNGLHLFLYMIELMDIDCNTSEGWLVVIGRLGGLFAPPHVFYRGETRVSEIGPTSFGGISIAMRGVDGRFPGGWDITID